MNLERVKLIAQSVLYEGYILYPYRASAAKNQHRFNFGVLVPRSYGDERCGSEPWTMRTECLIEGDEPLIDVRVRFLHLMFRQVFRRTRTKRGGGLESTAQYQRVPNLEVDGKVYHTWQETIEREVVAENVSVHDLVAEPHRIEFVFGENETFETLRGTNKKPVGRLTRHQHRVQGTLTIRAVSQRKGLKSISVEIQNTTSIETGRTSQRQIGPHLENRPQDHLHDWKPSLDSPYSPRNEALLHAMASTHTILGVRGGQFVSSIDPPQSLAEVAAGCENVGTWPVLVGNVGERDMMLSSPIILYDYPQIAPESRGDFFDGTEIDEMLALRVMTLTDREKCEMRNVDERARSILLRTESLEEEHWKKLHGAIRKTEDGSIDEADTGRIMECDNARSQLDEC